MVTGQESGMQQTNREIQRPDEDLGTCYQMGADTSKKSHQNSYILFPMENYKIHVI